MTPETPHGLVRAIRAALDETERIARDLTMDDSGIWSMQRVGRVVDQYGREIAECTELGRVEASHIAHNDPAAVLRRVAADREIVERCEQYARWAANDEAPGFQALKAAGQFMLRALARGLGINPEEETP